MTIYAVKLNFLSPLHIGELGLGMEEAAEMIHSDTLYAAVHRMWLKLFSSEGSLPVIISSAYPYIKDKYYLPKPGLAPPGFDDVKTRENYAKPVKSTKFLSCSNFEKWIKRETIDYEDVQQDNESLESNISKEVRPRVKLDRVNSNSALYHIGEVSFSKNAGLYFLVECEEDIVKTFQGAVTLLGDEGLGGERSSGYGRFYPEFIKDFKLPRANDGDRYITISLYYPASKEEFTGALESYQVFRRSGWTNEKGNSFKQNMVYMFSEGSVFKKPVEGCVANVAPENLGHPVYRYGRAFLIKAR